MLREACKYLCLPSTRGLDGLRAPDLPTGGFRLSSSSLLECGGLREAQRCFWAMASIKQIAVSLQRMRKYPKLSLVGQLEVGVSPSVIDYFKAVFQWSMPRPLRTRRLEQWRHFYCCNHFSHAEFGRRGKAGDGRGASMPRGTTGAWQKLWLKHEVVAQQSLAIGVESSSAQ